MSPYLLGASAQLSHPTPLVLLSISLCSSPPTIPALHWSYFIQHLLPELYCNLRSSSFNLHHFILGVACSGFLFLTRWISQSITNSLFCAATASPLMTLQFIISFRWHLLHIKKSIWLSLPPLLYVTMEEAIHTNYIISHSTTLPYIILIFDTVLSQKINIEHEK